MNVGLLTAVAAAIAGPLIAYLAAARKLSGKIDTSEASQLWEEARAIRGDYRQQLDAANLRVSQLEARIHDLEESRALLTIENRDLNAKLEQAKTELVTLKAKIASLEKKIAAQQKGVTK